MLLLTATSTPLSTTDARYVYRCLDAASKHVGRLDTLLHETNRLTKTLLSRCHKLAQSAHKKLSRCVTVLGNRNALFNTILSDAGVVTSSLASKLMFPARYSTRKGVEARGLLPSLSERVQGLTVALRDLIKNVGQLLTSRKTPGAPDTPQKEIDTKPTVLEDFFTKVEEDKGWKVQRALETKASKETVSSLDSDLFGLGCHISNELSRPYSSLLSEEIEVGLISFSIILLEAYRLPKTVLTECNTMSPLHRVFGSYVILQNALLIGVHQDLMEVMKNGQGNLDDKRFQQFIPYLSKSLPKRSDQLARTFPSGPPRYAKYHYYSPLLPRTLINGAAQFSLGNWSFLTEPRKARTEHSCKDND